MTLGTLMGPGTVRGPYTSSPMSVVDVLRGQKLPLPVPLNSPVRGGFTKSPYLNLTPQRHKVRIGEKVNWSK